MVLLALCLMLVAVRRVTAIIDQRRDGPVMLKFGQKRKRFRDIFDEDEDEYETLST